MYELPPFSSEKYMFNVTGMFQENLFIRVSVMCLGGPDFFFDKAELTVEGIPLGDSDGVSDTVENMVPNAMGGGTGDGNGDGVADGDQDHVASLPNHASAEVGVYTTLVCSEAYPLVQVQSLPALDPPEGWDFSYGALSLEVDGIPPGESITLVTMVPVDMTVSGILKMDVHGTWHVVSKGVNHGPPEAPSKTVLSFQIVDGGTFDEDGKADGGISDDMFIGIEIPETGSILILFFLSLLCPLLGRSEDPQI
jgi:hypothetical protein